MFMVGKSEAPCSRSLPSREQDRCGRCVQIATANSTQHPQQVEPLYEGVCLSAKPVYLR